MSYIIKYSELPLGIAIHGVITVYDDAGRVVRSYEGLAYNPSTNDYAPIGMEALGYRLRAVISNRASPNSDVQGPVLWEGDANDAWQRVIPNPLMRDSLGIPEAANM